MGSMQSESKTIYSEDTFSSNVKFAFKGKGVARLMSREMHNGTIISLNDSTVSNIDFKKKKYSVKTFNEILKDKENKDNQNENDNQDNSDNENINEELKFIIFLSGIFIHFDRYSRLFSAVVLSISNIILVSLSVKPKR